jgi:hypothetical protein
VDDEAVKLARLALVAATAQVLHNGLAVLGVSRPRRCEQAIMTYPTNTTTTRHLPGPHHRRGDRPGGALAVAVYVTKVPVPFMNKGQSRTAEQDAAEARKNKDWDPNAPLYGKNPARRRPAPRRRPPAPAPAAAGTAAGTASARPQAAEAAKPASPSRPDPGRPPVAKARAIWPNPAPAGTGRQPPPPTRSCISCRPAPSARPRTPRPSAPSCR